MSDEPETVYVLPYLHGGDTPKLHADPDCWTVQRSDRDPVEKPRDIFPADRELCNVCANGETVADDQREPPARIEGRFERRQAVHDVLADAGEPLTRREIQLEALLSKGATDRTLRDLEDLGQIEQVDNPEDGRKPRYRLASMCRQSATRQRAQVEPVTTGLATLFSALVLIAGYAIATGVIVG